MDTTATQAPITWWQTLGNSYIAGGGIPSEYVEGEGYQFLSYALQGNHAPRILDHGVWDGRHLPVLKRLAIAKGKVCAIDHPLSWYAVENAINRHPDVEFQSVDGFVEFPFPDRYFDAILSWRTLHNLTAKGELNFCLNQFARSLHVGCPLLVSVLAERGTAMYPHLKLGQNSVGSSRYSLYFSVMALPSVLGCNGKFRIVRIDPIVEGSIIDGVKVHNQYWAVQLVRCS